MGATRFPEKSFFQHFAEKLFLIVLFHGVSGVIVSNITLITESNRTDYVLHGESATLYCNYATSPGETVSSVRWEWKSRGSEEASEVYYWRPGRRPVGKEVFFGRIDVTNDKPGFVVIRQAHMEMEGRYKCLVQTNQMTAHTEFMFIVVVDACHDSVWRTTFNVDKCIETIHMNCVGLFPKPTASCGVYSELTKNQLTNVPFDRVLTLRNGTYEITLNRVYDIRDWSVYTNITFMCYFVIDGTSWKRGIRYRLFGAYGCSPEPPSPGAGTFNMSEEQSCWANPREGAVVRYSCNDNKKLVGPDTLVCRDGVWTPERPRRGEPRLPTCNSARHSNQNLLAAVANMIAVLWLPASSRL